MADEGDERGFLSEMPLPALTVAKPASALAKPKPPKPHHHGHRERLRERFAKTGPEALPDYELLELLLFRSIPRADTKVLAKALIADGTLRLPALFRARYPLRAICHLEQAGRLAAPLGITHVIDIA